jgi:hypothetical protein
MQHRDQELSPHPAAPAPSRRPHRPTSPRRHPWLSLARGAARTARAASGTGGPVPAPRSGPSAAVPFPARATTSSNRPPTADIRTTHQGTSPRHLTPRSAQACHVITSTASALSEQASTISAAALSPALAPGRSPMPWRLSYPIAARPCGRPTPTKRGRIDLRTAESQPADAARIGDRTSATATPGTCHREGGAQSGTDHTPSLRITASAPTRPNRAAVIGATSSRRRAATPCGLTAVPAHNPSRSTGVDAVHSADIGASSAVSVPSLAGVSGTATNLSSPHPNLPLVAVSAHDPSQRAPLASAGPSDARTQGGPRSSAAWADRGQSSAPARRRQRRAVVRGVGPTNLRTTGFGPGRQATPGSTDRTHLSNRKEQR